MPLSNESGDTHALTISDNSVTSEKLQRIAKQYNSVDAWLYAFPTPSDFLRFFEKKLQGLEQNYSNLIELANEYKSIADKGINNEEVIQYLGSKVNSLENQLSDIQGCLYDERENYVKLVTENEQLKLENEDFRRKFQAVLILSNTDERDVTLFMQKNPKAARLTDKMVQIKDEIRKCQGPKKTKHELLNPVVLVKQVEVLENHIKELNTIHREKDFALKQHIKLLQQEKNNQKEEYENRLKSCVDSASEAKNLVHNLVLENVQTGKDYLAAEQDWANEREKLLKLITQSHIETIEPLTTSNCLTKKRVTDDSEAVRRLTQKVCRLETQLISKENLIDEYKIKFMRMEKQIFQMKELNDEIKKIHKDDVRKLSDRNKATEKRCEELDTRRRLDNAGFREDIRGVKVLLAAIERKFRLCALKKRTSQSHQQSEKGDQQQQQQVRTSSAPSKLAVNNNNDDHHHHHHHHAINPESRGEDGDSEKEVLTWEALNQLLHFAAERVGQLERRIKLGCPSAKF